MRRGDLRLPLVCARRHNAPQTAFDPKPRLLIADDQADVGEALRLLFKCEGWKVEVVGSPAAALEAIARAEFDLLFADLNYTRDTTSGQEG